MPYTMNNVPDYVPADKKKQWSDIWNKTYDKAKKDGMSDKDAEAKAFSVASGVLKKAKEKSSMTPKRELRFTKNLEVREQAGKPVIHGYAARFNSLSHNLGGFREKIAPGAFSKAIASDDIRALVGHDPDKILGRNKAGTLTLREDENGLYCEIQPPDTTAGRDVVASIKRGDLDGMSFGFGMVDEDWGAAEDGQRIRELREVSLFDVSVVTYPAYPATSVSMRSLLFPDGVPPNVEKRMDAMPDHAAAMKSIKSAMDAHQQMASYLADAVKAMGGATEDDPEDVAEDKQEEANEAALDESGNIAAGGDDKTQQEAREAKTKSVGGQDLHASDFAYVGDSEKTDTWKLPIHDKSHAQNALARFNQTEGIPEGEKPKVLAKIKAAATKFGIHVDEEKKSLTMLEKIEHMNRLAAEDPIAEFNREQERKRKEAEEKEREFAKRFDY